MANIGIKQKHRVEKIAKMLKRHKEGTLPKCYYVKGKDGKPHITRNAALKYPL